MLSNITNKIKIPKFLSIIPLYHYMGYNQHTKYTLTSKQTNILHMVNCKENSSNQSEIVNIGSTTSIGGGYSF